jgi:hypothetical protein
MEHDHSLVDKSVEVPEVVNSPNLMTSELTPEEKGTMPMHSREPLSNQCYNNY